ncbi:MAG: hypothetical protein IT431_09425 [Phycisphaerales bacterium]|nr:hypothetical protein [Phycisphaerales bacterium]
MATELVVFVGSMASLGLISKRWRRARRWLIRWWPLPIMLGVAALYGCVSNSIWMASVPDKTLYYPSAWGRCENCIPVAFGGVAVVMTSIFLVERGCMTEEDFS